MENLAWDYAVTGRLKDALGIWEETLKRRSATVGTNDSNTIFAMVHLGNGYLSAGRTDEALPLLHQAAELSFHKLGPGYHDSAHWMLNLAEAFVDAGRVSEVLPLLEEAERVSRAKLGPAHPNTVEFIHSLAMAYHDTDRLSEAIPLYQETLTLWQEAGITADMASTRSCLLALADCYLDSERFAEAEAPLREALAGQRRYLSGVDLNQSGHQLLVLLGQCLLAQKSIPRPKLLFANGCRLSTLTSSRIHPHLSRKAF